MYILVLGSAETLTKNPTYYAEYAAFATAAMPEAVVDTALFDDLYIALGGGTFTVENLNKRRDLREYDLIMVRGLYFRLYIDMIKTVSTYAASHGVALINDQSSYRSGSKLDQAVRFHQENIPAPFTVMATTASLNMAEAELGITFPCIMKATLGAHGSDNHIVKTAEEARAIQASKPDMRYILQQFVPNNHDYRVLIIGNEMLIIERKAQGNSHLNNTSQGGSAALVTSDVFPEAILTDARCLASAMDQTVAGVDIVQDSETGEYYVLEVNSQPQLVSGAFLEEKKQLFTQYLRSLHS